jgi:hypothetical protein
MFEAECDIKNKNNRFLEGYIIPILNILGNGNLIPY